MSLLSQVDEAEFSSTQLRFSSKWQMKFQNKYYQTSTYTKHHKILYFEPVKLLFLYKLKDVDLDLQENPVTSNFSKKKKLNK